MYLLVFHVIVSVLLALSSFAPVHAASVTQVIGSQVLCDLSLPGCTPIPLTLTTLCVSSCPRYSRPSYTDVLRMWGSGGTGCRTSVNGGGVWAACTTEPFSSGGKESYAGTVDGFVVGHARVGIDCQIKKSIDNGSTWTLQYTGVGETCGGPVSGVSQIQCFTDSSCVLVYLNAANNFVVVRSTDNGSSWVVVFTGTTGGAVSLNALSYENTGLVMVAALQTAFRGLIGSGAVWTQTAAWVAGTSNCSGAFFLGGLGYGACWNTGTAYKIVDQLNGSLSTSPTLPGIFPAATGGASFGLGGGTVYTLAAVSKPSGPLPIGVYVSGDSGATYSLVAETPTTTNSMAVADFWRHPINGCLYFSGGTTPHFAKICQ